MQVLLPGMVQWVSFHAPAVVWIKLCPEATNSLQTHLIAGTVPASGKLLGFLPRSDYNKEGIRQRRMCHLPIMDGKRRRMPLLLRMCSTVSVEIILILIMWVAPVLVSLQLGLHPGQERSSSRDSLSTAQAGEAVLNEVNLYGTSALFHLKGRHKTSFSAHTERCPKPLLPFPAGCWISLGSVFIPKAN